MAATAMPAAMRAARSITFGSSLNWRHVPPKAERPPVFRRPPIRMVSRRSTLLLAPVVGHVRDARDLAVLVHADVLVADRVVVLGQRVDHDLIDEAVALVVDADALVVDDLDGGLGSGLAGDRAEHAVEQRHVAPVGLGIAGIAHG